MKKVARTYEELLAENAALRASEKKLARRVAYLERILYGPKSDRLLSKVPANQPGLFDEILEEEMAQKASEIEAAAAQIEKDATRRRAARKKKLTRPARYNFHGLEERTTVVMPQGVDPEQCDVIGRDITRILHHQTTKVWVEVIERPILRHKEDKNQPYPRIWQSPAPLPVIGGGHVGADVLAQIIVNKYQYSLPEYRQIKQYADLGVSLPASTINDWVHAVACKLDPLYEALRDDIRRSDYLQVDEVPWRIADRQGKSRKGYAWQFLDNRPRSHGLYFLYINGSRAGTIPRAELREFRGAIQTDGYGVYDFFETQENVTLLGRMAHVRRKFTDAQKSCPQVAAQAVKWIGLLYTLEENLRQRDASPGEVEAERREKALAFQAAFPRLTIVRASSASGFGLRKRFP